MYVGLTHGELRDLARFMETMERAKDDYGPELIGTANIRLASQQFGTAVEYNRRGDGTYEVFLCGERPEAAYVVTNDPEEEA